MKATIRKTALCPVNDDITRGRTAAVKPPRSGPCCLALACLFRGRKELVDPGLPQRLFAPSDGSRLRAVEIETNRTAALAPHHDGQKVCDARRRLVEPNEELLVFLLDDAVDDPREPRRAVRC